MGSDEPYEETMDLLWDTDGGHHYRWNSCGCLRRSFPSYLDFDFGFECEIFLCGWDYRWIRGKERND